MIDTTTQGWAGVQPPAKKPQQISQPDEKTVTA
jgi:hypothetical protein